MNSEIDEIKTEDYDENNIVDDITVQDDIKNIALELDTTEEEDKVNSKNNGIMTEDYDEKSIVDDITVDDDIKNIAGI